MRKALLTAAFALFLYPVSIDGVSVNYAFLLLPLFYLTLKGKVRRPQEAFLLLMGWYTLVYIAASLYQYQFYDEALRRVVSFVLFMSMFSYMFLRIDSEMISAFKTSIVVISLFLSIFGIYLFFGLGGSGLGFEAKDLVGSQRVGFVYLLAIWLVYLHQPSRRLAVGIRYLVLTVLLIGLFLTFSRSSIVGLLVSFGVYALANVLEWVKRPNLKALLRSIGTVAVVGLLFVFIGTLVPLAFAFFEERLFLFLLDSAAVGEDLEEIGSAGTRLVILGKILDFVVRNPLTGAGYLGVWTLFDTLTGSAHNQYADVLFRTGVVGFIGYLALIVLVTKHLWKAERSLFWGFIGVLCYGLFHETFKESQGAFLLAFLLGMMSQSLQTSRDRASKDRLVAFNS